MKIFNLNLHSEFHILLQLLLLYINKKIKLNTFSIQNWNQITNKCNIISCIKDT